LQADGRSSGTAYVVFSARSEVEKALELDGSVWPGTERWLKIEEAKEKPKFNTSGGVRPEGCDTVFVGNLPWDVSEDQMKDLFGECGEVLQVRFATGEDGGFRGFGHVQFTSGEACDAAVKLAGSDINGRAIRVDYAPPRNRPSFGDSPRGGRGGGAFSPRNGGGRDGGRGRGGRDGGRGRGGGRGGASPASKNKGAIQASAGKKMTFDDE